MASQIGFPGPGPVQMPRDPSYLEHWLTSGACQCHCSLNPKPQQQNPEPKPPNHWMSLNKAGCSMRVAAGGVEINVIW